MPEMDYAVFRKEATDLFHQYLHLWLESGGDLPDQLPGYNRPHYVKFELIVNLDDFEEQVLADIDELKSRIMKSWEQYSENLIKAPDRVTINSSPRDKKGRKRELSEILDQARKALQVYLLKDKKRVETAENVLGYSDVSEPLSDERKNAERNVRKYLAHAEALIQAAGNGTFFEAIQIPLPKK